MASTSQERLTRLCASLAAIVRTEDRLEILGDRAEGPAGCAIRYRSKAGSASELEVSADHVRVTTRSEDLNPDAGDSEIVDRLGVDLGDGYMWDAVRCTSADELARLLVRHLYRRAEEVDPEPRLSSAD